MTNLLPKLLNEDDNFRHLIKLLYINNCFDSKYFTY